MPTIVEAIASGQLDLLKAALVEDARSINEVAENGEYPIHKAVKAKSVKMVEMLIVAGANINQPSEETGSMKGYTAAHYAARNGDVDTILLLAKHKADFSREASDHWQPVHCAAFSGKRLALLALLDNGASINAKTNHGHTPLVYAVNHGRTADVRELLSRGASMDVQDPNGDSLLHHCFHYQMSKLFEGEYDVPDVQLDVAVVLAIAGCPIEKRNLDGNLADFYYKDDIPSVMNILKILSHNSDKFKASKTEWNYMTLLSAKPEHFMGVGLELKHAMDLYETMMKANEERKAAKKRREEERPAGGCPVMRGKKKKATDGEAAAGDATGAASGHPAGIDMKNYDPNGPDPSGGQCPFFKKKAPAVTESAVSAAAAAIPSSPAPPPPAHNLPAHGAPTNPIAVPPSYTAELLAKPAPVAAPTGTKPGLNFAFLYENSTVVLLMVVAFLFGMVVEQWSARLFGRRY